MRSLKLIFGFLFLSPALLLGQSQVDAPSNTVVATYQGHEVTLDELVDNYLKNSVDENFSASDLQEFLPFYLNYKLKLQYGLDRGFAEDDEVISEFESYTQQAAYAYWLENDVKDRLFQQFVNRNAYELKSFHILHRLEENSHPSDVIDARTAMLEARQKYLDGTPIEELDREYSTHVRGQSAGGSLPWFSAGTTVKPFEDALYALEEGEISMPVRTQFGYHLILLQEKRERTPDRFVKHIFFRSGGDEAQREAANTAYDSLESGMGWAEAVQSFSEDGSSVSRDGNIGWVGYGSQFTQEFIDTIIRLDADRSYSEPILTNYGHHIFRVDSVRTYQNTEQKERDLRQRYEQLPTQRAGQKDVINRLSEVGNLQINDQALSELTAYFQRNASHKLGEIEPHNSALSPLLISFNAEDYHNRDFWNWISQKYPEATTKQFDLHWFDDYKEHIINSRIVELTSEEYPEFNNDIENYLNGLIVFQVSDEEIWNPATADSAELKQFFDENRDNYRYETRYSYVLLASRSDSVLNAGIDAVKENQTPEEIRQSFSELGVFTDTTANISEEPFSRIGDMSKKTFSEHFEYRNRMSVLYLEEILSPRNMTFEEAFNRVASDYQPIREKNFLDRLYQRYSAEMYTDRIR